MSGSVIAVDAGPLSDQPADSDPFAEATAEPSFNDHSGLQAAPNDQSLGPIGSKVDTVGAEGDDASLFA